MDEIDNSVDLHSAINTNQRFIALFSASWCPFCQTFLPIFQKSHSKQKFIPILSVNLDDYDNNLWDEFFIEAVPTLILFENRKIRKRLDGKMGFGINKKQLEDWLRDLWFCLDDLAYPLKTGKHEINFNWLIQVCSLICAHNRVSSFLTDWASQ